MSLTNNSIVILCASHWNILKYSPRIQKVKWVCVFYRPKRANAIYFVYSHCRFLSNSSPVRVRNLRITSCILVSLTVYNDTHTYDIYERIQWHAYIRYIIYKSIWHAYIRYIQKYIMTRIHTIYYIHNVYSDTPICVALYTLCISYVYIRYIIYKTYINANIYI